MSRIYCLVSVILIAVSTRAQTDSISDLEGNRYRIVKIGEQWWMAENLKVGKYRYGDPIAYIESDALWASADSGAYCCYGNREQFRDIYGNLFNWHAITDERGICPDGWHVPSDEEWIQLEMYLGMSRTEADRMTAWRGTDEGDKLKSTVFNGNNASGFAALGTGYRAPDGTYRAVGSDNDYWTSTPYDNEGSLEGVLHGLLKDKPTVVRNFHDPGYGFCARCVKDISTQIHSFEQDRKYILSPNPSADFIRISSSEGKVLTLHNLYGQVLLKKKISGEETTIDISDLNRGTYIIRILGADWISTEKLVRK